MEPAPYCDPLIGPVFDDSIVSPDGTEFNVKNGHVDLILAAISEIGIATFTYQGPLGFTCGPVDQNKVIIFRKNYVILTINRSSFSTSSTFQINLF